MSFTSRQNSYFRKIAWNSTSTDTSQMQIIEVTTGKFYHIYVKTSSQKKTKQIKCNINGNRELENCGKRKKENEF